MAFDFLRRALRALVSQQEQQEGKEPDGPQQLAWFVASTLALVRFHVLARSKTSFRRGYRVASMNSGGVASSLHTVSGIPVPTS
jgi:hypothetical protein